MKKENEKIENNVSSSSSSSLSLYQGNFMSILSKELKTQLKMSPFLPYFFVSTSKSRDLEPWRLFLVEDKETIEIGSPFTLVSMNARPTIRRLVGDRYTTRYYCPKKEGHANNTRKEFFENLEKARAKEDGWDFGLTHLMFCLSGDEAFIGTYESFGKTELGEAKVGANPFFSMSLLAYHEEHDMEIVFDENDFSEYVAVSKSSGGAYLASYFLAEDFRGDGREYKKEEDKPFPFEKNEKGTWEAKKIGEKTRKILLQLKEEKKDSVDGFMNR